MKESIYTIPISEAFEKKQGCPFCEIHRQLECRWIEYITGPVMMEPDVRVKTNEAGFCERHYGMMLEQRNRLSVALLLQTHLDKLYEDLRTPKPRRPIFGKDSGEAEQSCFICGMLDREFDRILENAAVVWQRDEDFQKMYIQQEYVCLPHCGRIIAAAQKKLRKGKLKEFSDITTGLASKRMLSLKSDIDAFCRLYDYRSAEETAPSEETATAIERSIEFLTAR